MHKLLLVLACSACACHGRRVKATAKLLHNMLSLQSQKSSHLSRSNRHLGFRDMSEPSSPLARLLAAPKTTSAFRPSHAGVRPPVRISRLVALSPWVLNRQRFVTRICMVDEEDFSPSDSMEEDSVVPDILEEYSPPVEEYSPSDSQAYDSPADDSRPLPSFQKELEREPLDESMEPVWGARRDRMTRALTERREVWQLGAQEILSKHARALNESERVNVTGFNLDVMLLVLSRHPQLKTKIGAGVESIFVAYTLFASACFHIQRVDGSVIDFSYRKCLDLEMRDGCQNIDRYDAWKVYNMSTELAPGVKDSEAWNREEVILWVRDTMLEVAQEPERASIPMLVQRRWNEARRHVPYDLHEMLEIAFEKILERTWRAREVQQSRELDYLRGGSNNQTGYFNQSGFTPA